MDRSNELIPVEVKSRRCPPSGPHASDAAQLTAYCVLVEDSCGVTPSHGIIQYANRTWPIRYTVKGRERLLEILDEMRAARQSEYGSPRPHPGRSVSSLRLSSRV